MSDCLQCDGTGWKPILVNGERRVIPCACRQRARLEAAQRHPGGFATLGQMLRERPAALAALSPLHQRVAELIERHVGEAEAIPIRALGPELFRDGAAHDREVKALVRDLRRLGLKIGSKRTEPYGYYMISTARELASTVAPLLRQAIDELRTIEALTGRGYYTRELEGQLKLEMQETR